MNQLTSALAEVCRRRLLDPKWLLAPSRRVGQQWLDVVSRSGQPVANVQVQTIKSLALELAGPKLASRQLELISELGGELAIDRLWNRFRAGRCGYLTRLASTSRFAHTLFRAVRAMRLAGLDQPDLRPERFEVASKGEELIALLDAYRQFLADNRLVDSADVLRLAIARLSEPDALPRGLVALVPSDLAGRGLEQALIDSLPAHVVVRLAADEPAGGETRRRGHAAGGHGQTLFDDEPSSDLELVRYLGSTTGYRAMQDGTATIYRAVGEANEVREVLRRCLCSGHPLDEIEIVCSDPATYVPLFYELMPRLDGPDVPNQNPPITIQDGIPARYSRPGRALLSWVRWLRDDCPQHRAVRMLQDGLIQLPQGDERTEGYARLAGRLRSIPIGFGRQRYLPALDAELDRLRQLADARATLDDPDERRTDPDAIERGIRSLALLRGRFADLLEALPAANASPTAILRGARRFLSDFARCGDELDNYSRQRMVEMLDELEHWLGPNDRESSLDIWTWLEDLARGCGVEGSGPRPGCLHVASLSAGGHSGRPITFVVGLDDGRFPGQPTQDPLLLDSERERLSSRLPTAAGLLAETLEGFYRLLARLRGRALFSYSCSGIADDREQFPSPVLLGIYRLLSGNQTGDRAAFERWVGPPAAFAPTEPLAAMHEVDWWLARLSEPSAGTLAEEDLGRRFPHLVRGCQAERERAGARFTGFDGRLGPGFAELDPFDPAGPVLSAARLEAAGRCPLRYFFRYVLDIAPLEGPAAEDQWLDPLTAGSLLHQVFEQFVRELSDRSELPDYARDRTRLLEILAGRIEAALRDLPPPSEHAYQAQRRQLEETARTFLREEENYYRQTGSAPAFLETSIGMPATGRGTPLDTAEPAAATLPGGRSIRLCGRVDRVDRLAGCQFALWDYKTGSSTRYTKKRPYHEGRVIQHAAYLALVRQRLRQLFGPEAAAVRFGYFFPGPKPRGERVTYSADELTEGMTFIERICRTIANGAFLPTTDAEDCKFCDYASICVVGPELAGSSRDKLKEPANELLAPLRELRTNGTN